MLDKVRICPNVLRNVDPTGCGNRSDDAPLSDLQAVFFGKHLLSASVRGSAENCVFSGFIQKEDANMIETKLLAD